MKFDEVKPREIVVKFDEVKPREIVVKFGRLKSLGIDLMKFRHCVVLYYINIVLH